MLIVNDIKMRRKEEVKTIKKRVQPLLTLSLNTIVSHLTEKVVEMKNKYEIENSRRCTNSDLLYNSEEAKEIVDYYKPLRELFSMLPKNPSVKFYHMAFWLEELSNLDDCTEFFFWLSLQNMESQKLFLDVSDDYDQRPYLHSSSKLIMNFIIESEMQMTFLTELWFHMDVQSLDQVPTLQDFTNMFEKMPNLRSLDITTFRREDILCKKLLEEVLWKCPKLTKLNVWLKLNAISAFEQFVRKSPKLLQSVTMYCLDHKLKSLGTLFKCLEKLSQLKNIDLDFDCNCEKNGNNMKWTRVDGVKPMPNVKRICINRSTNHANEPIVLSDICRIFPNLVELEMYGIRNNDEPPEMKHLQTLKLEDSLLKKPKFLEKFPNLQTIDVTWSRGFKDQMKMGIEEELLHAKSCLPHLPKNCKILLSRGHCRCGRKIEFSV